MPTTSAAASTASTSSPRPRHAVLTSENLTQYLNAAEQEAGNADFDYAEQVVSVVANAPPSGSPAIESRKASPQHCPLNPRRSIRQDAGVRRGDCDPLPTVASVRKTVTFRLAGIEDLPFLLRIRAVAAD